ncbi:MAG: rod shape-determining protein RodA [candidate division Zixibacteria bacterium RBG_16_53_22]|nr:MAG: rod shape-determining protein RodA [candidate division Zixibacteria bacterium RBG_16_53_22]
MSRTFNLGIFIPPLVLSLIGIILIYSATYYSAAPSEHGLYSRQIMWLLVGLALCLAIYYVPLRVHEVLSFAYYGVILILLGLLLVTSGETAERWFRLGPFSFQPSEFAKLAVAIALARYLAFRKLDYERFSWVFVMLIIIGIPAGLVLVQPDLGSSLVFFALFFGVLIWTGMPLNRILLMITPLISMLAAIHWFSWGIFFLLLLVLILISRLTVVQGFFFFILNLGFGMITPLLWNKLHGYQKMRIIIFLDPGQDPRGAGYQIIQSKIAIGAGGIFGQGFLKGSQTKLNFLPEQHTDFIFSALSEQFGLIGGIIVVGLFGWLFYKGFSTAYRARNAFYSYIACGLMSVLVFQVLLNIGMTMGLMPVTGLPLPFLSYGGSSLLFFWAAIGFLMAINRDWQEY